MTKINQAYSSSEPTSSLKYFEKAVVYVVLQFGLRVHKQ